MKNNKLLIAIDGPAASGKGTLADLLGKALDLQVLHTGNIYRAIAYKIIENKQDANDLNNNIEVAKTLKTSDLDNENLNQELVGEYASIISVDPKLREVTYKFQRNFIEELESGVIEGRDIGTVICPEADFKFYVTADVEVRAERRSIQAKQNYETILTDLKMRDDRDQNRAVAPLKPAKDAIIIDSSKLTVQQTLQKVMDVISKTS